MLSALTLKTAVRGPAPTLVKPRRMPTEMLTRMILRERCSGTPLAEQEARLDQAVAHWVFWSGWSRMWDYIGRHAAAAMGVSS